MSANSANLMTWTVNCPLRTLTSCKGHSRCLDPRDSRLRIPFLVMGDPSRLWTPQVPTHSSWQMGLTRMKALFIRRWLRTSNHRIRINSNRYFSLMKSALYMRVAWKNYMQSEASAFYHSADSIAIAPRSTDTNISTLSTNEKKS